MSKVLPIPHIKATFPDGTFEIIAPEDVRTRAPWYVQRMLEPFLSYPNPQGDYLSEETWRGIELKLPAWSGLLCLHATTVTFVFPRETVERVEMHCTLDGTLINTWTKENWGPGHGAHTWATSTFKADELTADREGNYIERKYYHCTYRYTVVVVRDTVYE